MRSQEPTKYERADRDFFVLILRFAGRGFGLGARLPTKSVCLRVEKFYETLPFEADHDFYFRDERTLCVPMQLILLLVWSHLMKRKKGMRGNILS